MSVVGMGVAVSLACGGVVGPADEPAPAADVAERPASVPASLKDVPEPLRASLPKGRALLAVDASRDRVALRYDADPESLLAEVVAACEAEAACTSAKGAQALYLLHDDPSWSPSIWRVEVEASRGEALLTLSKDPRPEAVTWPHQETCGSGRVPVRRVQDDDAVELRCYAPRESYLRLDGPTTLTRDGVVVLSGEHQEGARHGRWTLRGRSDEVISEGAFAAGRPVGAWTVEGQAYGFDDQGRPTAPMPWMELTADPTFRPTVDAWSFELLDADLASGHVGVRWVYEANLGEDRARACAYPGLPRPTDGVHLSLLQAGLRPSLGGWTVYASQLNRDDGPPCTTEAEASAALSTAKQAFSEHGLDTSVRTPLVPLEKGSLTVSARTVRVGPLPIDVTDEEAMRHPDTLAGGYLPAPYGPRVEGFRVTLDDVEVHRVVIRSDPSCAGRHEAQVAGAIVQGERLALVWSGVHADCKATVPFVWVGPVW